MVWLKGMVFTWMRWRDEMTSAAAFGFSFIMSLLILSFVWSNVATTGFDRDYLLESRVAECVVALREHFEVSLRHCMIWVFLCLNVVVVVDNPSSLIFFVRSIRILHSHHCTNRQLLQQPVPVCLQFAKPWNSDTTEVRSWRLISDTWCSLESQNHQILATLNEAHFLLTKHDIGLIYTTFGLEEKNRAKQKPKVNRLDSMIQSLHELTHYQSRNKRRVPLVFASPSTSFNSSSETPFTNTCKITTFNTTTDSPPHTHRFYRTGAPSIALRHSLFPTVICIGNKPRPTNNSSPSKPTLYHCSTTTMPRARLYLRASYRLALLADDGCYWSSLLTSLLLL